MIMNIYIIYDIFVIYVTWVHWSPAALPPTFCTRGPPESPFGINKDKVTLWDKYQISTRALIQQDGKIQTMNNELTLQDPRPPAVSMQTTPSPTIPYTALQSALVITGMSLTCVYIFSPVFICICECVSCTLCFYLPLTSLRTGEMPPALSEGLPQPVTVTRDPTAGVSPVAGRHEVEM